MPASFTPSSATPDDIERYMTGECHHLAVALHRNLGWRMEAYLDNANPYWEDENDSDNFIATVLHVYAVDKEGNLWDVKGCRNSSEATAEMEEAFSPEDMGTDEMRSEGELRTYVGYWVDNEDFDEEDEDAVVLDPIDRPLDSYEDKDIAEAWQVAQRVFAKVAGFCPELAATEARPRRRATP